MRASRPSSNLSSPRGLAATLPRAATVALAAWAVAVPAARAGQSAPAAPPVPGAPTGVQTKSDWPQEVAANGRRFRVYAPLFNSMAGTEVGLQVGVQRLAADGSDGGVAGFGLATVLAQASPGMRDGDLEVGSFAVQSLTFADGQAAQDELDALQAAIAGKAVGIPRAALLQDMQLENARGAGTPDLGIDFPAIMYSDRPAVLLQFDGPAIWRDLGTTGWRIARNTPYTVLQAVDGSFNVRLGSRWASSMELGGFYRPAATPPRTRRGSAAAR